MEGDKNQYQGEAGGAQEDQEVKSRGVFDFLKKKEEDKDQQEAIVSGMENVHVTEADEKKDEEKKEGLFAKLHRSDSSSSSSSDEEEVGPDGEKRKKKKGLKEKIKEKIGGDKKEEHDKPSDDIKTSTLPTEHVPPPPPAYSEDTSIKVEKVDEPVKLAEVPPHDQEEKKGIIEKIKDKLPGQKKPEDVVPATTAVAHEEAASPDGKEKKGILGKIMEKIKGPEQKEGENKSGESH